jgi:PAS domain S-box-containing protein
MGVSRKCVPTLPEPAATSPSGDLAFRKLVEGAPDGIVISREARIIYANPAAVQLLGYDHAGDLVGQPMGLFLDQAALTTMRLRLQRMRETGEPLTPSEYSATRRDGTVVTVEISSLFIEYEGAPAVLAFARDVTERSRLRAQLAHADRLASLGTMAAGVAHEINNPLAFVMLAADMLEREPRITEGGDPLRELVRNIRTGIRRIASIVRDLRTYGQYEDEPPGGVDLATTLESAISITAHEVRSRARLRREHGVLPPVLGVAMRLEQVFVNLLLNAAHSIDERRTDGEIVVSVEPRDKSVIVEVIDNGAGIDPELLPRIFEPFVTTKSAGEGVGLGLSICRDIVVRWGGRIEAQSQLGKGTTLRVTLPVAKESDWLGEPAAPKELVSFGGSDRASSVPPRPASVAVEEPPSHVRPLEIRRRILVVDDEPLTVAMATAALREAHDVVGVTDPEAGLDRILGDESFEVIVCDLMMPGLTGMDIYERVKRERPGLADKIIFLTGGPYTQRARAFLESVPNRRLMKPLSIATLESLLASSE